MFGLLRRFLRERRLRKDMAAATLETAAKWRDVYLGLPFRADTSLAALVSGFEPLHEAMLANLYPSLVAMPYEMKMQMIVLAIHISGSHSDDELELALRELGEAYGRRKFTERFGNLNST